MVKPYDIRSIPNYYSGTLWRESPKTGWQRLVNHTAQALKTAGYSQRNYDIHVPIIYEREKFLALRDWWERSRKDKWGFVAKSIYGNIHCEKEAVRFRDVKLGGEWPNRIGNLAHERWVFSYSDGALKNGLAKWMQGNFPAAIVEESKPKHDRVLVAVLGQFRGGTSAVAGVLHTLGVDMGSGWPKLRSNQNGTYEDRVLAKLCRRAYHEPDLTRRLKHEVIRRRLAKYVRSRPLGTVGVKHPTLCLMVPQIIKACDNVRFIAVERPIAESVRSIRKRMWRWSEQQAEEGTKRLIAARDRELAKCGKPVLRIAYHDLLANPRKVVDMLIKFCGISPGRKAIDAAIAFVDSNLRTVFR
jgi:hypothetical protein